MAKKKTKSNPKKPLDEQLVLIDEKLQKMVSLKEAFKHGVVRGLGTAIGASIIAAIVLSLISFAINIFNDLPFIDISPITIAK